MLFYQFYQATAALCPTLYPVNAGGADAPDVTGTTPESGDTLTCTTGDWTGAPTITFVYQWCQAVVDIDDELVTDIYGNPIGIAIEGETSSSYGVQVSDVNERIFCIVTGTNAYGSGVGYSNVTDAVPAVAATTTFDTADATSTLSGGNLIVSNPGGAAWLGARSITHNNTGLVFCQFTVNTVSSNSCVGIILTSGVFSSGGGYGGSIAIHSDGSVYRGGVVFATFSTYTTGDVISMAIDRANCRFSARVNSGNWNANVANDPAVGYYDYSVVAPADVHAAAWTYETGSQFTANFGATTYSPAAPGGYGNW